MRDSGNAWYHRQIAGLGSHVDETAQALREAFVQLLVERGYAAITIREVVAVAGTGLGSFYEYFASKEDIALVCLHLRSKALLLAMHASVVDQPPRQLANVVDGVVAALLQAHGTEPLAWRAHYTLERHLSSPEAYRKMYDRFVAQWALAFASATDLCLHGAAGHPSNLSHAGLLQEVARVSHTLTYGLFAHAFIAGTSPPDLPPLGRQARTAVIAYVQSNSNPVV